MTVSLRTCRLYAVLGSLLLILWWGAGPTASAFASAAPAAGSHSTPGLSSLGTSDVARVGPKTTAASPVLTSTNVLSEVVQSASGLTTVEVEPLIIRTNGDLLVTIQSLHLAQVLVTLTYPDGETVQRQGHTNGQGSLAVKIRVLYQPLDRSANVTLTVQVTKDSQVETVPVTLTLLRQATLTQSRLVVRPLAIHAGQSLFITVHSLGNVQVHLTVTDPGGQTVSADGFTDAGGTFETTVPVSYNPGKQRGAAMVVSAWLSYGGEQSFLRQTVPFVGR